MLGSYHRRSRVGPPKRRATPERLLVGGTLTTMDLHGHPRDKKLIKSSKCWTSCSQSGDFFSAAPPHVICADFVFSRLLGGIGRISCVRSRSTATKWLHRDSALWARCRAPLRPRCEAGSPVALMDIESENGPTVALHTTGTPLRAFPDPLGQHASVPILGPHCAAPTASSVLTHRGIVRAGSARAQVPQHALRISSQR